MARRAGNSVLAVQFFGGEPLLNWQAMQHIFSRFGTRCGPLALAYSVVTSGSIVNEEMARAFRAFQVPVLVPRLTGKQVQGPYTQTPHRKVQY